MCIFSCLNDEIFKIRQKFLNADYPRWFINRVIEQFNDKLSEKSNEKDDYILPTDFFEIKKQVILIEVPYCEKNETSSKCILKNFLELTNALYEIKIKWITKKMRNLFHLKSKNPHPAGTIYNGVCTCKENYIGETKRNVETQWEKHSDINNISEPSRHLKSNPTHAFPWKVLMTVPINDSFRKNLEVSFIALSRRSLNEQIDSKKATSISKWCYMTTLFF